MELKEAINASPIWAARGYNHEGQCECSVAFYGEKLTWLSGLGGFWAKKWEPLTEESEVLIGHLDFLPFGPKQEDEIEDDILKIITEIHSDEDDFEPMGETHN